MVMAVCAPDSSKSLEMYEVCVSSTSGRTSVRDFIVELGMMCTDKNDIEELDGDVRSFVLAGVRQRCWWFQEIDVV